MPLTAAERQARRSARAAARARALAHANGQEGVLSLRQVYAAGVTRAQLRAELAAGRWRRWGSQCVAVHTGPLPRDAELWAAVLGAGPRAHLDAAAALEVAGLRRFDGGDVRVSVPRGARVRRARGVAVRQTRRFDAADVVGVGIPRSRPEVAAVRGALWADSDRQATLLLTMTVQQGIATTERIATELLRIRRDRRRRLVGTVLLELAGGAESLGEIDVARECRRRGLPEPTRQARRRARDGSYFLDVWWEEYGLVLEIDGIHHAWAENVVADAIRHNAVTLSGADTVLRLPLLGLRFAKDEFFDQIEAGLRRGGWSRDVPAAAA
jgi:very-short-patch-repair endonuclease